MQRHIDTRLREAGAPPPHGTLFFGLSLAGPTMVTHGSDELRKRALRPMFTGEEIWCQLFSEPGAGSDLAGLVDARGARRRRVDRQRAEGVEHARAPRRPRACSSRAPIPSCPKHKGLTYFMVDMHAPGVEVRPLRQITGEAEFNEVYLTDVRIADADRIGDIGDGWRVSMTTLMNERTTIGVAAAAAAPKRGSGSIAGSARPVEAAPTTTTPRAATGSMKLWMRAEVLRLTNMRAAAKARAGNPGPGRFDRQARVREPQQGGRTSCASTCSAPTGIVDYDYTFRRPTEAGARRRRSAPPASCSCASRANSIEGGTSEIMRNILGERILGLPGEPRVDRDLPWSQVPRS